jgi:hypothetical protein
VFCAFVQNIFTFYTVTLLLFVTIVACSLIYSHESVGIRISIPQTADGKSIAPGNLSSVSPHFSWGLRPCGLKILNVLNNKTVAGSIFCGLEKALDSVNHDLLLSKLPSYGISGKAKLLIESYLHNRYQRFQILACIFILTQTQN